MRVLRAQRDLDPRDEVYQGLVPEAECSVSDLYARGVSTSSMSKTMALAGLRIGWIHARDAQLLQRINARRDYHVISESALTDALAQSRLRTENRSWRENRRIVQENRRILHEWLEGEPLADCVIPRCGTVCFLQVHLDMPSAQLREAGRRIPAYSLRLGHALVSKDICGSVWG